ncbi:hypothetical protein DAEQUDRAFT_728286 [Daedalea quercina L-15889]|uniref:Uncharacterized protein n=1 Tax=Daedalea quercina L-15889 TaxID=1314783 RepID=A0A165PBY0_9APHY|nr:hypothetical protein DAEQUDRAFT_728286 [Daedalea quercina L-15889]
MAGGRHGPASRRALRIFSFPVTVCTVGPGGRPKASDGAPPLFQNGDSALAGVLVFGRRFSEARSCAATVRIAYGAR